VPETRRIEELGNVETGKRGRQLWRMGLVKAEAGEHKKSGERKGKNRTPHHFTEA